MEAFHCMLAGFLTIGSGIGSQFLSLKDKGLSNVKYNMT